MSKNLIYMVAINHHTSNTKNSDYSDYSIKTWKWWCDKNDIDFMLITEHDNRLGKPVWNKELIFERAKGYDKIGIIDSDTMVKWDAPNIFELYGEEFCGVVDNSNLNWVSDSIKTRKKFFPNTDIDIDEYINAGVLFFTKNHLSLFKKVFEFYKDNQDEIDNWNQGGGKEQTILNYILKECNFKRKFLTPSWNLFSIHRKEMFHHNWQLQDDETPFFVKYAYVWHFTGFSIEDRVKLMENTWNKYGSMYK